MACPYPNQTEVPPSPGSCVRSASLSTPLYPHFVSFPQCRISTLLLMQYPCTFAGSLEVSGSCGICGVIQSDEASCMILCLMGYQVRSRGLTNLLCQQIFIWSFCAYHTQNLLEMLTFHQVS